MSCILRVHGRNFAVDDFLARSALEPYEVWHKGDKREHRPQPALHNDSGFKMVASTADLADFEGQIRDVVQFLTENFDDLSKLKSEPGVDDIRLDFGLSFRKVCAQYEYFPPELIRLAGALGMGIEVSHYGVSNQEETSTNVE